MKSRQAMALIDSNSREYTTGKSSTVEHQLHSLRHLNYLARKDAFLVPPPCFHLANQQENLFRNVIVATASRRYRCVQRCVYLDLRVWKDYPSKGSSAGISSSLKQFIST